MKRTILLTSLFLASFFYAQSWSLTGNSGINSNTNFLGTTDNHNLIFKVNNSEKISITNSGRIIIQGLNGNNGYNNNFFLGGGNETVTGVGNNNIGVGNMLNLTTGNYNTSFGANALSNTTTGNLNIAIGINSMMNNIGGNNNVALGGNSLYGLGVNNDNVAIGHTAMARYTSSSANIASSNTAIGTGSLINLLDGTGNVGVGKRVLEGFKNGNNNIAIGLYAADNLLGGSNNIYIGEGVKSTNTNVSNELNIGNWILGKNGTIGIGTFTNVLPADGIAQDGEKYKLFVKDGIKTEKVKVDVAANNGWADYVFKDDYQLKPLNEVEKFIEENGHLPEVPSEKDAIENGIELKAMNILLLKKIEELTLHAIQQEKRIKELEEKLK